MNRDALSRLVLSQIVEMKPVCTFSDMSAFRRNNFYKTKPPKYFAPMNTIIAVQNLNLDGCTEYDIAITRT